MVFAAVITTTCVTLRQVTTWTDLTQTLGYSEHLLTTVNRTDGTKPVDIYVVSLPLPYPLPLRWYHCLSDCRADVRVRVQCRQIQIPKVGADRNEEIIPANRLTQPAATIRTCTDKQRTFFVPTLGICIWNWICLHCTRTLKLVSWWPASYTEVFLKSANKNLRRRPAGFVWGLLNNGPTIKVIIYFQSWMTILFSVIVPNIAPN